MKTEVNTKNASTKMQVIKKVDVNFEPNGVVNKFQLVDVSQ